MLKVNVQGCTQQWCYTTYEGFLSELEVSLPRDYNGQNLQLYRGNSENDLIFLDHMLEKKKSKIVGLKTIGFTFHFGV